MTFKSALLVFLVLLILPLSRGLAEEGTAPESSGSGMLGKIVNFVILFGALVFFLRKPIRVLLAKRTSDIRAALEDEVARIKTLAENDALVEKGRLRALAEYEAVRIRTLAAQDVDARLKAGVRELKAYAAELAAELAEARIKARMTDDLHGELIDRSIEKLGALHEKSGSR